MTTNTDVLRDFLDTQREHALGILEGLNEEQLRLCVLPSGSSPLGMVKHLALDVEHYWVSCIVAGESLDFFKDNNLEGDKVWQVGPEETSEEIFALYRSEIVRSIEINRLPLRGSSRHKGGVVGRVARCRSPIHPLAPDRRDGVSRRGVWMRRAN